MRRFSFPVILLIWVGMVLGVSFFATPIKFQAQSLARPVALEVGLVTFAAFAKVEWGMAVIATIAALISRRRIGRLFLLALLVIILILQAIWLSPALAQQAMSQGAEGVVTGSHHLIYVVLECLKVLLLFFGGLIFLRRDEPIRPL